jgi:hypothetical protein
MLGSGGANGLQEFSERAEAGLRNALGRGAEAAEAGTASNSRFWKASEVDGRRVYQRDDLFDPQQRSSWQGEDGQWVRGSNVERMGAGNAPIGYDGKPVQLHHMTQTEVNGMVGTRGSLAEVSASFHQRYTKALHFPKPAIPKFSSFRRNLDGSRSVLADEFDTFRDQYWQTRAGDFK